MTSSMLYKLSIKNALNNSVSLKVKNDLFLKFNSINQALYLNEQKKIH